MRKILALSLLLTACETKQEREARLKDEARFVADAEDAAAQAKVALEARFRSDCKLKQGPIYPVYDDEVRDACHDRVRASLKVPGSDRFPTKSEEPESGFKTDDGCHRIYTSYVDAKNAFGVAVRTVYACTYDPRTGLYSVKNKP